MEKLSFNSPLAVPDHRAAQISVIECARLEAGIKRSGTAATGMVCCRPILKEHTSRLSIRILCRCSIKHIKVYPLSQLAARLRDSDRVRRMATSRAVNARQCSRLSRSPSSSGWSRISW